MSDNPTTDKKQLICPFMSCRLMTRNKVITDGKSAEVDNPVIAKCQGADCAVYDKDNKVCSFLSIKMEINRLCEAV